MNKLPAPYMQRSVSAPAITENLSDAILPGAYARESKANELSPSRHNPRMSIDPSGRAGGAPDEQQSHQQKHMPAAAAAAAAAGASGATSVEGSNVSYGNLEVPIISLIGADTGARTPMSLIQADFPSTPSSIFQNRVLSSDALNAGGALPSGDDSSRSVSHLTGGGGGGGGDKLDVSTTGLEQSMDQLYVSSGASSPIPSGQMSTSPAPAPMPLRRPGSTSPFASAASSPSKTSANGSLSLLGEANSGMLRSSLPTGVDVAAAAMDHSNAAANNSAGHGIAQRKELQQQSQQQQSPQQYAHHQGQTFASQGTQQQQTMLQQQQATYYLSQQQPPQQQQQQQQQMFLNQNGQNVFYRPDVMYGAPGMMPTNQSSPLEVHHKQFKSVQDQQLQDQQLSPRSPQGHHHQLQQQQQQQQQQQMQATFGLQYPGMGGQVPQGYWTPVQNDQQMQMQMVANAAAASAIPFNLFLQNFGGNLAAAASAAATIVGNSSMDGTGGVSNASQRRMIYNPATGQFNAVHSATSFSGPQSQATNSPSCIGSSGGFVDSGTGGLAQATPLMSSGGSYPLGNSGNPAILGMPSGLMSARGSLTVPMNELDNTFLGFSSGNSMDSAGSPSGSQGILGNGGMNRMMGMTGVMGTMSRNNMLPPSATSGMNNMPPHLQGNATAAMGMGHPAAGMMGIPAGGMVGLGMAGGMGADGSSFSRRDMYRSNDRGMFGGSYYGMQQGQGRDRGYDYRDGRPQRERRGGGGGGGGGHGGVSGGILIRDPLVEEFRNTNGKGRSWELRDILGHVTSFCQDQHGSRFIQQRLEECTDVDKQLVFDEIVPSATSLMTDVFGNYVLQKLFEFGTAEQCEALAVLLQGQAVNLSMHMYGCRVMQRALEYVGTSKLLELVGEFENPQLLMRCVYDSNGNHVIQKCIEVVSRAAKEVPNEEVAEFLCSRIQFIISSFQGQVRELSSHPYGCRVIQRILEHCASNQKAMVLEELRQCCHDLIQDCYGNYVIQYVMQHGWEPDRTALVQEVLAHLQEYSMHKFASNVVEKCLLFASKKDRDDIIWSVINVTFDLNNPVDSRGQCALEAMVRDPYANYVVQKVIEVSDERQRAAIMRFVRENIAQLRRYTYGKHIILRLEKLTNEKF